MPAVYHITMSLELCGSPSSSSLLIGCVALLMASWLLAMKKTWRMPPGPFQWPIVGNLPQLAAWGQERQLEFLRTLSNKYNGIFSLKFGDYNAVLVSDVNLVREALVKKADCFSDRPCLHTVDNCLVAFPKIHAIVFENGDRWKYLRRFAIVALRDMGVGKTLLEDKIHEEMVAMVTELEKVKSLPFDVANLTGKAVTNIIASILFGKRYNYGCERFQTLLTSMKDMISGGSFLDLRDLIKILQLLPFSKRLNHLKNATGTITKEIERQIEKHVATYNPDETKDFIDLCLKEQDLDRNKFLDRKTLVELGLEFFVAGAETTGTTLSWAWLYMAQYPDVQNKCQKEIDENLGTRASTMADRKLLPFCEATLAEVARISTIVPLSGMHQVSKDTTLGGYDIPEGTWFLPMLYMVHSDPKLIKDADKFYPQRYLDSNGDYTKSDNWIPFGLGPRSCAGEPLARMELFIIFTSILQKFTIRSGPSQQLNFKPKVGFTSSPLPQDLIVEMR